MTDPLPALATFLDGPHAEVRARVREWLSEEGNAPRPDLELEDHRAQVLAWALDLASRGETTAGYPVEYGGRGGIGGYNPGFRARGFRGPSLLLQTGGHVWL